MTNMVEVSIESIRVGLMSQQRVVILKEKNDERYLAIWIDPYMAEQITFSLQEVEVARPMSHDLMKNLIQSLDARVVRVEISALSGEVFYGNIVIELSNGHQHEIDSRPSDALALAVRCNVPIYVSAEVLQEAGIFPEQDLTEDRGRFSDFKTDEENEKINMESSAGSKVDATRLSIFEQFFESIDSHEDDTESKSQGSTTEEDDSDN